MARQERWEPMKLDPLPEGVEVEKDYGTGYSLVRCYHPQTFIQLMANRRPICSLCKTTDFSRPVRTLAIVPLEGRRSQEALF